MLDPMICGRCPYLWEQFTFIDVEKKVKLYVGCSKYPIDKDVFACREFIGRQYELVRNATNANKHCGMRDEGFMYAVDAVRDDYDDLRKSVFNACDVPSQCEYFVEQKMRDWNR